MKTLLAIAGWLLAGCVEHRVALNAPPPGGEVQLRTLGSAGPSALARRQVALAWGRDAQGRLVLATGAGASPLPRWQNFPLDLVAEIWPGTLRCQGHLSLAWRLPDPYDPSTLDALAARAGYGPTEK